MKNDSLITLIVAAGKGTRMKSEIAKVVHKLDGKELVLRVEETAEKIGSDEIIAIVGHKKEQVIDVLGNRVKYAYQDELLGTGHAVMQAVKYLEDKEGRVVILYGDVPIIKVETLKKLINQNKINNEKATLLTAIYDDPTGYGRIIHDKNNNVSAIVEEKDASLLQKKIKEINSGLYCFDIQELLIALKELTPNNAQGEYYLTDVIKIMYDKGLKIGSLIVEDNTEILGVNTPNQLKQLEYILKNR